MGSCKSHYETVLSPVYSWMLGGHSEALERNRSFFDRLDIIAPRGSGRVVDLGAGSGFQAIPLAERGFSVTAIDLDSALLDELREHAGDLPVEAVQADLLDFRRVAPEGLELAICITDTVLHLETKDDVEKLFADVRATLEPGGRLIMTFRDLTRELTELDRFIPVRSDENAILTCFLEYEPDTVKMHDLVYQRRDTGWELGKSFYRKLRLSRDWAAGALREAGFKDVDVGEVNGLITVVATRNSLAHPETFAM